MHTFSETGTGVPAFLAKLWRLVEDPETNNLICWSKDGRSFIIQNQAQFARELLPLNYKHNNMASFIRQLNMYGFHKITSIDSGGLKFDRDEMEFTHPCFKRNCPYLLEHIKRKIASNKSVDEKSTLKPEAVTKVLQDVKAMRGRQDSLDSRFSVMKQENEALWREIASLRQKHAKQQQIVNKLIQFLITIVQPQRNMTSVKRHMQLMINDTPNNSKMRKTSESERDSGPVIHELGEELMDEVSEIEPEVMLPNSPFARVTTPSTPMNDPEIPHSPPHAEDPATHADMISQNFDFSNQCAEDSGGYLSPASTASTVVNSGLIQTVNNDGSKIFYHITEVPDATPSEPNIDTAVNFNEENVLTTPLVRKEMKRNQLLKLKNRQKRYKNVTPEKNPAEEAAVYSNTETDVVSPQQLSKNQKVVHPQTVKIKSEQDPALDSMLFLNVYPNNGGMTPDSNIISPNFSEESFQSNSNTTGNFLVNAKSASSPENEFLAGNSSDLYNPNSFIANDIPADIFEDNSINSGEENFKKTQQEQQLEHYVANNGNFSTYLSESTSQNELEPSTSAAAAAAALTNSKNNNNNNNNNDFKKALATTTSIPLAKNKNIRNMALAKCKNNKDFMRLSTAEEVSGHLDIVQDELEGLKDLLRSDGYSLDQNALLGIPKFNAYVNNNHQMSLPPAMEEDILNKLFNDSDILEPYGLHLSIDNSDGNAKKGSELMTYQPMYDLSDIINDQNNLDADVNMSTAADLQGQQQSKQEYNNSVLNTPYHE